MAETNYKTALIVGVGSGLSASLARLFAKNGMKVALAARRAENLAALAKETGAKSFVCDSTKRADVTKLFTDVEAAFGAPDVVVYNASYRTRGPFAELVPEEVEKALAVTAYGAFLVAQEAAKRMVPKHHGAIFFTGASAGVKGYPQSAPFAMGKFALRGLAQSMARELSPQGIHVAHFVIRRTSPTACSIPMRSRRAICICWRSRAAPGPGKSNCGPGLRSFEFDCAIRL
jgi:NAD(P)-dependent dehydrogenase (short-subunit alcohol dehydrogenase family)